MAGNGPMNLQELGRRVRRLRKELDMSAEDLAKRIGRTRGYVSRLENGKAGESVTDLLAVARELGLTLAELVGETDEALLAELRQRLPSGTDVIVIFERLAGALSSARDDDRQLIMRTLEALAERYAPAPEAE